jgi:hypothetical protein
MDDLPPDPFLPDDPRIRNSSLFKYFEEGKQLTVALANQPSQSSLVEALHKIDRRDLELVAMHELTVKIFEALGEVSRLEGLTEEETSARWLRWVLDPPSDGTLDDV